VEAGKPGISSGDEEKLDPYMQPFALRDMLPNEKLEDYILKGIIQSPLAFMRGRTDHAFVILDEAQNTTHSQMKMFLTRMGCKIYGNGDPVKSIYQEEPFQDLKRHC
jgi:phosphate starvation-inducible PhoH-like protein